MSPPLDLEEYGRITGGSRKASAPVPAFSPSDIPGLLAWWDAGQNVVTSGTEVTSWTSRDANAYVFSKLVLPGPEVSTLLGKPALLFSSGASNQLYRSGASALGNAIDANAPFTCYFVGQWSSNGTGQYFLAFNGINFIFLTTGQMRMERNGISTNGPTVASRMYVAWIYNGTTASFRFDGVPNAGGVNATAVPTLTDIFLGSRGFSAHYDNRMAQIIFYDHVLTAGETTSLEAWIVANYPGI